MQRWQVFKNLSPNGATDLVAVKGQATLSTAASTKEKIMGKKINYAAEANNDTPSVMQDENADARDHAALPAFMRDGDAPGVATTPDDYTDENGGIGLPKWMRGAEHPLTDRLDGVFEADGTPATHTEAVKKHVGLDGMKSISKDAKARRKRNLADLQKSRGVVKTTVHPATTEEESQL